VDKEGLCGDVITPQPVMTYSDCYFIWHFIQNNHHVIFASYSMSAKNQKKPLMCWYFVCVYSQSMGDKICQYIYYYFYSFILFIYIYIYIYSWLCSLLIQYSVNSKNNKLYQLYANDNKLYQQYEDNNQLY